MCSAKSSGGLGRVSLTFFNGANVVCCSGSLALAIGFKFRPVLVIGPNSGFSFGFNSGFGSACLTGTDRTVVEFGGAKSDWSRGALSLDRICFIFLINLDESTCVGAMAAGGEPNRCP